MSSTRPRSRWLLVTGSGGEAGRSAAIAVFHIQTDIDAVFDALALAPVEIGHVRLRRFADIDRGVVARPAPDWLLLMPHAGPAVVRRIGEWLTDRGLVHGSIEDPRALYPEAATPLEAHMLHALAHAASPLAIDLLLDQPRRWRDVPPDPDMQTRSTVLNQLLTPPTIAALGPPNIGKSTLLNALAKRTVAIVADAAGTTRDHVGVRLDLAGLVVNYIDTPGIQVAPTDEIQRQAQEIALHTARAADLVLLCADSTSGFLKLPDVRNSINIGLRADKGKTPGAAASVSAHTGDGVEMLVRTIKNHLVPDEAILHPGRWLFIDQHLTRPASPRGTR